jgi:hypothetical protein
MEQVDAFDDELQATHKQLLEELHYDPETGEFTWLKAGAGRPKSGKAGGVDPINGYNRIYFNGFQCRGARLAYFYMTGEWPPHLMDHVNGVRSDDRWENLRPVTAEENNRNRKICGNNKSGVPGVSWHKGAKKWQVMISYGKSAQTYLGAFDSFSDAVEVRKAAEVKHGYHENHGREA